MRGFSDEDRQEGREIDQLLQQNIGSEEVKMEFNMKPKEVKTELDKDVIGQDQAKKYLANAVCYHYARIKRGQDNGYDSDSAIKKNVLMIGNTGVGKTYLVKKISNLVGVPFVKADATKFSATGYVGGNVEDMIRDLYVKADNNVQMAQYGMVYVDEIDKIRGGSTFGKDVSGVEVQRGLLKLMEETEVDLMEQMQKTGNMDKLVLNTKNILFIMSGAFPGLQDIVERRIYNSEWHDDINADDLVNYGFEAEFIGRLPIRVHLQDLSADDLYNILQTSGDSPIKQYQADFKSYGIDMEFSDEALKIFSERAVLHRTGARAMIGVFEDALIDYLYELPSSAVRKFTFTKEMAEDPRAELYKLIINSYEELK